MGIGIGTKKASRCAESLSQIPHFFLFLPFSSKEKIKVSLSLALADDFL